MIQLRVLAQFYPLVCLNSVIGWFYGLKWVRNRLGIGTYIPPKLTFVLHILEVLIAN